MRKISDFITTVFLLCILALVYFNHSDITSYIIKNYVLYSNSIINDDNTYTKGISYMGFEQTNNFTPSNKEELKNLFYTMLDRGWTTFSFYCDSSYTNYLDDIKELTDDGTFATINNYVHPYNSYKTVNVSANNYGIITINIVKNYTDTEIQVINGIINEIIKHNITNNMSTTEKIKVFHDFIVNTTIYDQEEAKLAEKNLIASNVASYKAYNVLVNGVGLCGGYTDTLAIFLNKIGINNFKVSTDKHVWNALLIDGKWYHIDMTWDDPVSTDGRQYLIHDYFMIDDNQLKTLDNEKHNYDKNFYLEFN